MVNIRRLVHHHIIVSRNLHNRKVCCSSVDRNSHHRLIGEGRWIRDRLQYLG